MTRLLIISNMPHHRRDSVIVGHGPTAKEISRLASLFDEVVHLGFLYDRPAPEMDLPYSSDRVRFIGMPAAGGTRWIDKFNILWKMPRYLWMILKELPKADAVHVRCPANVSMMAIMLLTFVPGLRRRWIKYAGSWQSIGHDAWSDRFQRWWLRRGLSRGIVTVNGEWEDQPAHIRTFFNPSLSDDDLAAGQQIMERKQLGEPINLLYVGQVATTKGLGRALKITAMLKDRGIAACFDVVGDGSEREQFEQLAEQLGLRGQVTFHGWMPHDALRPLYEKAHFMLFPTSAHEGWPKVLSEGMNYGVIPLAGAVSSIPQYLQRFGTGRAIQPDDLSAFADALAWYCHNPEQWRREAEAGRQAAHYFSYDYYLKSVSEVLEIPS